MNIVIENIGIDVLEMRGLSEICAEGLSRFKLALLARSLQTHTDIRSMCSEPL